MTDMRDPVSGRRISDEELRWVADHMDDLRSSVAEGRVRYFWLWAGLVIGLVVHVVAFLLRATAGGAPLGVLVDLLYALGDALWTGVVVAALVEVIPAAKERQITRALDTYETLLRARAGAETGASRSRPD